VKILLSAYACEPDKGSEASVGWHWAVELARMGHEVWVITRSNNRAAIDKALQTDSSENLHFRYYDLPVWAKWWKKGNRGVHLYYIIWQWGAYRLALSLAKNTEFDVVHHVTFVSARQPSFMGLLPIPFIFGPVAGGESAPWWLRKSYPLKGWLRDLWRDVANIGVRFDPLMHLTFAKASKIYVTSEQTLRLIPKRYRSKAAVKLAIGVESIQGYQPARLKAAAEDSFRVIFVGRLLYWKGLHLGLRAFAELKKHVPAARLTVIGSGPDEKWLRSLVARLQMNDAIEWVPWLSRVDVLLEYQQQDILLFPSLHDSGGMVVLEALASGLPVVTLDIGGPGLIVDVHCGVIVKTTGKREQDVVLALAAAMRRLCENQDLRVSLADGARACAEEHLWVRLIDSIYGIKQCLAQQPTY